MKQFLRYSSCLMLLGWFALPNSATAQIKAEFLGRFSTGIFDQAASEICAYDPATKKMFVSNGPDTSIKVVDLSNPANPSLITSISIKPYGIDLTSVACKNGVLVAAVIDSMGKLVNGKAVFFNTSTLAFLASVKVGSNPDMVTFTPDGMKVLVANEGEPLDYTVDPEGSVSIIDISNGVSSLTQSNVSTADFKAFNNQTIDPRIKITGKIVSGTTIVRNSTIAEDLEPEYITVSDDSKTAWVTCQENNAIARIDINTATVTNLFALGFKDHNISGQGLDPTNNDNAIGIGNYPVFGMYQPDAIASYRVGDTTYLITANEGDARADWGSINTEEIRFGNSGYVLDTAKFGGASNVAALKSNNALGRLNVTKFFGDNNNDGKMDSAFCFGARSFSVWNGSTGALVWDSKDEFEQRTAALYPNNFNATHNSNAIDSRSDDKGPEPEAATIGKILDSTYAFIGLERIGGVMIYNITNPRAPYFVDYINTRDFSVSPSSANLSTVGDLGAESIVFVPKSESPNGKDLLLVSNEVSGTVAVIQLNMPSLSIADARAVAAPGRVITSGIVTRAWGRFIYIQDATGAIAVRQSSGDMVNAITAGELMEGDSVVVIGPRNNFNNYAQIQLSSGSYNSSNMVIKLASARPLPAVQELTVAQLLANAESFESELIRIKNLRINGSGAFATSRNYEVWDGNNTGDSTILRIISAQDTEIEDAPALEIPTGKFTFEGILIQFCSSPSSGCNSGYQLQGTMKKDIQPQPELSSFALIDPANNARVVVKSGDNTPVVVRWNASATAYEYTWLSALPTGDFGTPLASFPSDNTGRDTTLTLTSGALDALVGSLGVNPGDSVTIKWTVEAANAFETRQADAPFTLTIVRFKDLSSVSGPEFMHQVQVYPNPAENVLHISNRNGSQMKYRFADVQGRTLFAGDVMDQTTLHLEQASAGIYFLELEFEGTRSTLKIVRK